MAPDLVSRIDEVILGCLDYLAEDRHPDIDRNLPYGQFWKEQGIALAESGVREPALEEACQRWKAAGLAEYPVRKIERWRLPRIAVRKPSNPSS